MKSAADMGRHSGRATPSLHDAPYRQTTGRRSTYPLPIPVQTNPATSDTPRCGGLAERQWCRDKWIDATADHLLCIRLAHFANKSGPPRVASAIDGLLLLCSSCGPVETEMHDAVRWIVFLIGLHLSG
jgi:hypothetical protein